MEASTILSASKIHMTLGRVHFPWPMTNVLISLLTIGQGPLLAPNGHFQVVATCPPLTDDLNMVTYLKEEKHISLSFLGEAYTSLL